MQLLKYFASKSSDLKQNEIDILKDKPIWPKKSLADNEPGEIDPKPRFVARYLHTPIMLHCEFGLPVISWNKGWSNGSEEGIFNYYFIYFIKLLMINQIYRKIFNQVGFTRVSYT
jgi:hypothetical protein